MSLNDKEIEAFLNQILDGEISEDDLEDDRDENEIFSQPNLLDDLAEDPLVDVAAADDVAGVDDAVEEPSQIDPVYPSSTQASRRAGMSGLVWKKKKFLQNPSQTMFLGNEDYSPELRQILDTGTPYLFFKHFFTEEIIRKIVEESNTYALQQDINKPLNLTSLEVKKFFSILLYMSVVKHPNIRAYWSDRVGFEPIIKLMPVNRFEVIRKYIHFNDNSRLLPRTDPQHDRLHKIRPIINHLNERFGTAPMEQRLSIDEQMCATKIAHFMKQYLPNKPHKWGFKLYVMCSTKGYAYKFEIYTGETNERHSYEPDFGPVGNVVVRLARNIPRHIHHILYFDNFYTSIPLVTFLAKEGICALGTVQANRLVKCKLPDKKKLMRKEFSRGFFEEQVTSFEGTDLVAVVWKDNKCVTFLSSFIGSEPVSEIERFDKAKKERIKIQCPQIVKEYNAHMGGVDLMDSFIGRYKITMRSRKWYMRIFYHLLDLAVINSWILYKNTHPDLTISLYQFRLEVADALGNVGDVPQSNKRGRPSVENNVERELQAKKKRGRAQCCPVKDVRTDNIGHWPKHMTRSRCKMPGCTGYTQTGCEKCGVSLCFTRDKNCFKNFHG